MERNINYAENYSFSVKLNRAYDFIEELKRENKKVLLYGNSRAGRIIASLLGECVVGVADRAHDGSESSEKLYSLHQISEVNYDILLVTVLGRESEIINELVNNYSVKKDTILTLNLSYVPANNDKVRASITDANLNIKYNRDRWGSESKWLNLDNYGYSWDGGNSHTLSSIAKLSDEYLKPYLNNQYNLNILELSPGGGRFTYELLRYAHSIDLVDMNEVCLSLCKKRYSNLTTPMQFYQNDGQSLSCLSGKKYDLIACFDSMVHMHPDIVEGYIKQFAKLINEGGIIWLDHSGKGEKDIGHRTDMTDLKITEIAMKNGLSVIAQHFRNSHDCISVLSKG